MTRTWLAAALAALLGGCNASSEPPPGPAKTIPPSPWILGPIYGTGCPRWSECVSFPGAGMADEVNYHLDRLAQYDIPISAYHFDGEPWSDGACGWVLGDALVDRLRRDRIPALLHFWGNCTTAADFDRVHAQLGDVLGGFYLDYGAGDVLARAASEWVVVALPGTGEVVMKAFGDPGETDAGLATLGHVAYVDDLPSDFEGLREGIRRVFAKAHLVGSFNEFTAYSSLAPDEETFHRRIHFGALQLVMDHSPSVNTDPWRGFGQDLLRSYRDYAWLHLELVPYLHSLDRHMFETGEPVLRDPDPERFTTRIGDDLFVAYVTAPGVSSLEVRLPPGEWIDFWDDSRLLQGTIAQPVPLGREPIFFRNGAIVPLDVRRPFARHGTEASQGSLTLLVYPSGESTFRYRDHAAERWVTLRARESAGAQAALVLETSEWPSQPILWRVARRARAPDRVEIADRSVLVDGPTGIPPAASEEAVARAPASAWFYDASARVLIVKLVRPAG